MENIEKFIPSLNLLIKDSHISQNIEIIDISTFSKDDLELKGLFKKYKSDKGQEDGFWPVYQELLKKYKNKKIRLLEIGLGTNNDSLISTMRNTGKYLCGGSVRSFRDYLNNAEIFGADIDKDSLFTEDRLKTCYVDQLNIDTFDDLKKNFHNKNFDFIIDDGLHSITANLNTLVFAINNLNNNGTIVIEDILISKIDGYKVIDYLIKSNYPHFESKFITYNNKSAFLYVLFNKD